jgi:hypothetical protein
MVTKSDDFLLARRGSVVATAINQYVDIPTYFT